MDREFIQGRLWHIHVGVSGRVNKPTDCYDVWHISENSGNYFFVLLVFTVAKNPIRAFELLFFAVFGQTSTDQLKISDYKIRGNNNQPLWTEVLFKFLFGIYMLVSVVVLINLLIAMMTDTYQRIQVNSFITEHFVTLWAPVSAWFTPAWRPSNTNSTNSSRNQLKHYVH